MSMLLGEVHGERSRGQVEMDDQVGTGRRWRAPKVNLVTAASHFRLIRKSMDPDQLGLKPQTSFIIPRAIPSPPPSKENIGEKY